MQKPQGPSNAAAPSLPITKRRRQKWYLLYYVLAAFDILAVLLSLYLGNSIMGIYRASVRDNQAWAARAEKCAELSHTITLANAPGNDVFASHDVAQEEVHLQEAVERFEKQLTMLQDELRQNVSVQQRTPLLADLATLQTAMQEMVIEARSIFVNFRHHRIDLAGQRMATMDRKYAQTLQALTHLREQINVIQKHLFDGQMAQAAALQKYEYLIALAVLFMLFAALTYGHKIATRINNDTREKQRYIKQLRTAETNLRVARDELEMRVEQRTAELAATNQALQTEINERSRIEIELREAAVQLEQSNQDLQDFASIASHDLQEPLRKIQAFAERLRTKYSAAFDETGRDYLNRVQNSAARMQTLINDLLSYSRVSSKSQPHVAVDLHKIAQEVIEDLETRIERTGGKVELGTLPVVEADPTQMRQVLQNLIGNGLKFCQPNVPPVVKIRSQKIAHPEQTFEAWCIEIEDNGIGFEEKYAERIFGIFQRLHGRGEYEGTGVGLAVVKKIVERHGGNITAQSQPKQGAKFIVTLPAAQEKMSTQAAAG